MHEDVCPLGCYDYEDEGCMGCGLCIAYSSIEFTKSKEKAKNFLKMSPEEREDFIRKGAYFEEN